MILSALFSFLGGSAFRMIWGEISAFFTARQDHAFEIERMKLQGDQDALQFERNQSAIKLQAELGVQTIRVQAEADIGKIDTEGWYGAVRDSMKPVGIAWVDAWNASIRPAAATVALFLWVRALYAQHWVMTGMDTDLMCAILGFFFADRSLAKRNK